MSPDGPRGSDRLCPGCERPAFTRRDFLRRSSMGFGWLAFAGLANQWAGAATRSKQPHPLFAARAKRVIFLFMDGGVSHVDTFDPKPELDRRDGQTFRANRKWLRSPWRFSRHGQCG